MSFNEDLAVEVGELDTVELAQVQEIALALIVLQNGQELTEPRAKFLSRAIAILLIGFPTKRLAFARVKLVDSFLDHQIVKEILAVDATKIIDEYLPEVLKEAGLQTDSVKTVIADFVGYLSLRQNS